MNMERKILTREFYELFIMDTNCLRYKDNVVLVPGFDQAIFTGDIMDAGRIVRIELDFEVEKTGEIAVKFASLANSLCEIGQWYLKTGSEFGVKPDEKALDEPGAMDVWAEYIDGYKAGDPSEFDLLKFMCFRYCKYEALGAPEVILINAARELSYAFIINGYSVKAERIDMLMEERDDRSYFPERKTLTLEDFRKMAAFLDDIDNVTGRKSQIFYNKTRTDRGIEKLYRELTEMDVN